MFNRKKDDKPNNLEDALNELFTELAHVEGDTEKYDKLTDQIEKLMKLREHNKPRKPVDPNTLILAGANILGIIVIVGYEQKHVLHSKAMSFIRSAK